MPSHCQYQVTVAITFFPRAPAAFYLLHQLQAEARSDATVLGLDLPRRGNGLCGLPAVR